ncbi:hypothetical protein [Luminiphilus sp. nBUS_07]|uniref:hypothetical protein n=1 Tax=Luminiphilus sp. nBUS_07 TaxID=3395314 RepID=UPI003EB73F91
MKQFQQYGLAAAVASIAAGSIAVNATEVSKSEAGDLAIIPYYTVLDGKNTGMHIINTTDSTQVVKVRLRRGADSKDALDFNIVMSPRDEWTANIGAGGDNGVLVTTNDTTCTVPEFPAGGASMPDTYAEGATEGYVEIIAMGQPLNEDMGLAVAAEHGKTGVPASCALVREHFYRVAPTNVANPSVRGVHTSSLLSSGVCSATAVAAATAGQLCNDSADAIALGGSYIGAGESDSDKAIAAYNLSVLGTPAPAALKVSYFVTDSSGGLEAGDNAFMVEGFAGGPMATNQQPLSFGTAGKLQYDPLNFELPNLAYGAYPSSVGARQAAGAQPLSPIGSGAMFEELRAAIDTNALINDWAAFETADGTVATDWVVTLPGQYAMNNPICDLYDSYTSAATACKFKAKATDIVGFISSAGVLDDDELPLVLASNVADSNTGENSRLLLWDREEQSLNGSDPVSQDGLGFSPGGSAGDPTEVAYLNREVNVLVFGAADSDGVLGSAELQSEEYGLKVVATPDGGDRGWAQLTIDPLNAAPGLWSVGTDAPDDNEDVDPNATNGFGEITDLPVAGHTMAIGFAVWERSFADQAGNYSRMVEHSTITSAGSTR